MNQDTINSDVTAAREALNVYMATHRRTVAAALLDPRNADFVTEYARLQSSARAEGYTWPDICEGVRMVGEYVHISDTAAILTEINGEWGLV